MWKLIHKVQWNKTFFYLVFNKLDFEMPSEFSFPFHPTPTHLNHLMVF